MTSSRPKLPTRKEVQKGRRGLFWAIVLVALMSFCFQGEVHAKIVDLGVRGKSYPVAENDSLLEIQQRAASVHWEEKVNAEKWRPRVEHFKPRDLVMIPKATSNRSFLVDPSYTLPYAIPRVDKDGNQIGVLYPKGYRFNPLNCMPAYQGILVFIDATDKDQVAWLKRTPYLKDIRAKIMLTDGEYYSLSQSLSHAVYYASEPIITRLQIQKVPSVVFQTGDFMKVYEVDIYAKNKGR